MLRLVSEWFICHIFFIQYVFGHAHIHCHMAESCSNQQLLWTNASDPYVGIHCHGQGACYNSTIRSDVGEFTPHCDAAAACIDLKQDLNNTDASVSDFKCGGYYGCYNAFSYETYVGTISCDGMKSCSLSDTNMKSNYITCRGLGACMENNIRTGNNEVSTGTLKAYGTLAMYKSNIVTMGLDGGRQVSFYFYGFLAGYMSSITCQGNDTCVIHCYSPFACTNIDLNCDDANDCSWVYYYDTDNAGTVDELEMYSEDLFEEISHVLDELDKDSDVSEIYENYTNYYNNICKANECRDKYSCKNDTVSYSYDQNDGGKYICINGYSAASIATITAGNGLDIVVDGGDSALNDMYTADNIHCRADGSCTGEISTNNGEGSVFCSGRESCGEDEENVWQDISTLYCLGDDSCQELTHLYGIPTIYALGNEALEDAVINSTGDASNPMDMEIYLGGYGAGDGMTINCKGSDTCTIYCLDLNDECLETISYDFNCDEDATCETASYLDTSEVTDDSDDSESEGDVNESSEEDDDSTVLLLSIVVCILVLLIIIAGIYFWKLQSNSKNNGDNNNNNNINSTAAIGKTNNGAENIMATHITASNAGTNSRQSNIVAVDVDDVPTAPPPSSGGRPARPPPPRPARA